MYSRSHTKRLVAKEIENIMKHNSKTNENSENNEGNRYNENFDNKSNSSNEEMNECEQIECRKSELPESNVSLLEQIKNWGNKTIIARSSFDQLLKILHPHHNEIPTSSKSLYKLKKCLIRTVAPGQYVHFGLEKELLKLKTILKNETQIYLDFGVDGLPLYKSSNVSLWPILSKVFPQINSEVMLIGVFVGKSKPYNVNCFLHDLTEELKRLLKDGIKFDENIVQIKVRAFICDAPAKSFMCLTNGHNSLHGCIRCLQKGRRLCNRTVYSTVKSTPITDEEFSVRKYPHFHKSNAAGNRLALEDIGVPMITSFPLDPMHVVDLGVMKKMLSSLKNGETTTKMNKIQIKQISQKLLLLSESIPIEFARKPRSLDELCRWKAVEFRQFLLYTGIFVLKDIVDNSFYEHFLLLHCAYRLLSVEQNYGANINVANDMLSYFVEIFATIYSAEKVSFNVHSLLHLTECVQQMGFLNSFSAYNFENFLQKLKKDVRKPTKILEQIYNRNVNREIIIKSKKFGVKRNRHNKITSYSNTKFTLKVKSPDNYCFLRNTPFKIVRFYENEDEVFVIGYELINCKPFFNKPMNSFTDLRIFTAQNPTKEVKITHNVQLVQFKFFHIELDNDNNHLLIPIIHTPNI